MMQRSELLFIQPLLGPDDAWAGYHVEFPPGCEASARILSLCCNHSTLPEFDQRHAWFIPALPEASHNAAASGRMINVFPANAARASDNGALAEFEERLRRSGCKLAAVTRSEDKLPATGTWDYLLIGASHARTLPPYSLLGLSSRTTIVITGVHSYADRSWALANACSLSSGEFLLARHLPGKKADTTRMKLLELLSLIAEDAETGALEAIFRQEAKLSYSLLRLVNSAAIAPRTPITCFAQAINLLGRRQLQRWLQLLVYADPNNGQHPNPLLQKAAARGRLMEILSSQLSAESGIEYMSDAAFMVGSFSLLDVLLNMPIGEILQQLSLPEPVRTALLAHQGQLGELLKLINSAEARDFASAERILASQPFDGAAYVEAQLQALSWAAKINPMA